jgi:hypothetical protein
MLFLAGLMSITYFGIALPILALWVLCVLFFGFASYRDEIFAWKTFFGAACVGAILWLSEYSWVNILSWMTLAYMVGWLIAGGMWFLFKWGKFVKGRREHADSALKDALRRKPEMSEEEKRVFMLGHRPNLDENKERVFCWILLWPFSVLSYIFGDLLRDIANWVFERLRGTAQRITDHYFGEFKSSPTA